MASKKWKPAHIPRQIFFFLLGAVLTGFLTAEGRARGRPVGVVIDRRGALLVADDVGNTVWRVARS